MDAQESTASTTYASLTTDGPSVTVTTGTRALVWCTAQILNTDSATNTYASYEVTGATTTAVTDTRAVIATAVSWTRASVTALVSLSAGSNTFHMLYRCGGGGGTGSWLRRRITVLPF